MEQQYKTLNSDNRKQKIINYLFNNKKKLISILVLLLLILFSFFYYNDLNKKKVIEIADKFNQATLVFEKGDKILSKQYMLSIIDETNSSYSILALNFLIDNDLFASKKEANNFFDKVINKNKLEYELVNLLIYKKALFNSSSADANELIELLNPIIKSDSIWKSHAYLLISDYFLSNNQNQKAREFLEKIIVLDNGNINIKNEAQKILQTEFSN